MAFRRAKHLLAETAETAPLVLDDLAHGPRESSMVLDLLPVPAVIVEMRGSKFHFEALNRPFRMAGLGTVAADSPVIRLLGSRLRNFLESDETHCEIAWQFGDEVDCRYFRVMFARRAANRGQMRCLVTLVDQTSELRTEYSLRREMATDSLTGLPNRAGFSDELENADRAG
jgi:hypothetical protein